MPTQTQHDCRNGWLHASLAVVLSSPISVIRKAALFGFLILMQLLQPVVAQQSGWYYETYKNANGTWDYSPVYASPMEACNSLFDFVVAETGGAIPDFSRPITMQPDSLDYDCFSIGPGYPGGGFGYGDVMPATYAYDPGKNAGTSICGCQTSSLKPAPVFVADPINASTGNKYLEEDDYAVGDWLTLRRFYNSTQAVASTGIGTNWRHSFDSSLELVNQPLTTIVLMRPDGSQETFTKANGVWTSDADISDTLTEIDNSQGVATGYVVFLADLRHVQDFNAAGLLQSETDETGQGITLTYSTASTPYSVAPKAGLLLTVTDPKGRQLNFAYNYNREIYQVTLPDGRTISYSYGSSSSAAPGSLSSVQYPDGTTRQYVYNESSLTGGSGIRSLLTGIIDETGGRYESTTYTDLGNATSSFLANNVDTTSIAYNSNGTTSVTYPLGFTSTTTFSTVQGVNKVAALDQPCGSQCNQPWKSLTYDANGNPQTSIDFNGNTTATTYNSNNLLTQQVDGQGTSSQRTTNFTWNTTLRVPLTRTVQDASGNTVSSTQWVYNATGQTVARCDIDPTNSAASGYSCGASGTVPAGVRRSTYTYCTAVDTVQCPIVGLLLTATGPRTDVTQTTTYSYYMASSATSCGTPGAACYQAGDLHTVTDPAGHVTTIASYDADGRPTRITDANGINTDFTYTPRGWLSTRTVGGAQTSFGYTPYGAVSSITDADGVTTSYGYD
ncbi:DUF6531 domain-containing protein, partial [Dyella monticola]|uniref:DUF6531 domain-containing protein n=1 Tax=Dyella monticola TaxID=1927958 RepID=UPI0018AD2FE7